MLRDGILASPRVTKLGWAEEVFYRRLMSAVDDYGRYYADCGLVRAACYPRQLDKVTDADIERWLEALAAVRLVRVYTVDGERYLELLDFRQQVRAKKSKFPQMLSTCVAPATQTPSMAPANAHLDVDEVVGVGEHPPPPTDVGGGPVPPLLPEAKTTTATPKPETAPSAAVWLAYRAAYEERYHTAPVRNATVNGQLRNLVARLGAEEAPLVAVFYVASQDPLFVKAKHGVGVLLNQCEAIRTTWATRGRSNVTSLSAVGQRSADNLQHWVNDGEPSNGTQGP